MFAQRVVAGLMRSSPKAAVAMSAAMGCAQTSSPSECAWFWGKSKEVVMLETRTAKLEEEVKLLEKEKQTLEEKISTTTLWSVFRETAPEGGADLLAYGKEKAGAAIEAGLPQDISYGFAAGGCVGYASKIALKVMAATAGGVFIFLQLLQYNEIIKINHARLGELFKSLGDLDGDGDVDADDLRIAKDKYMAVMGHGLATGSGFAGGFMLGFRRG
uniref:EF-hand domain-containing protein n=1 Tax=Haptolina brevifila TaxID=156173 RepID=A0A7S2DV80_9EUKA|mmetsp:Transcript_44476/g.88885  ORF Transcript_44476/g.88885 Transcript_44476/m.88885 type:complete len:216 (+) Transcript_44476:78-725(+)